MDSSCYRSNPTDSACCCWHARYAEEAPMAQLEPDVYGRWPVLEALRAGHVARVYLARELRSAAVLREIEQTARAAGVPVQGVPRVELDRALTKRNHQGVAAAYHQHPYASLDEIVAM